MITDIVHALFSYTNLFTLESRTLPTTAQGLCSVQTTEFSNRSNFWGGACLIKTKGLDGSNN